jgi:hypothetical protein
VTRAAPDITSLSSSARQLVAGQVTKVQLTRRERVNFLTSMLVMFIFMNVGSATIPIHVILVRIDAVHSKPLRQADNDHRPATFPIFKLSGKRRRFPCWYREPDPPGHAPARTFSAFC